MGNLYYLGYTSFRAKNKFNLLKTITPFRLSTFLLRTTVTRIRTPISLNNQTTIELKCLVRSILCVRELFPRRFQRHKNEVFDRQKLFNEVLRNGFVIIRQKPKFAGQPVSVDFHFLTPGVFDSRKNATLVEASITNGRFSSNFLLSNDCFISFEKVIFQKSFSKSFYCRSIIIPLSKHILFYWKLDIVIFTQNHSTYWISAYNKIRIKKQRKVIL